MRVLIGATIFLLSLLLGIGYSTALYGVVGAPAGVWLSGARLWWLGGFLAYFPVHILFRRLILLHVFGHELTHALWSMLFGGRVQELYVSRSRGGFATYTKSNFFVSLAPYFFPLYAIIFLLLWLLAASSFKPYLVAFTGFATSFHIFLTVFSIRQGQTDLKKNGIVPALFFIYAMNCILLGSIFCVITGAGEVTAFLRDGLDVFAQIGPAVGKLVQRII